MPERHQPTEEICDGGFAVLSVAVDSIVGEINERKRGLARDLRGSGRRLDSCGSLALFAWCAMRAVDYLYTIDRIDRNRIAVVGHGIYGTAALLAAAYDSRISIAISNSAGPSGVAKRELVAGELFELKCRRPDLFCKRFYKMSGKEDEIPFDGDALLRLIAPRRVLLDNAEDLLSRCAEAELTSAISASKYYENTGVSGLLMPNSAHPCEVLAREGEICYTDGALAYRRRSGLPYVSREDWQAYMEFVRGGEI
jgi:pimeloyl-ACP methyl ester carboxylesterase